MALKEESREEKKMEKPVRKNEALNLSLPSTPTLVPPDLPKWQRPRPEEGWRLQEESIVRNLRFNLEQLKVLGDESSYMDLVEKLVIGPTPIRATHMEQLLGIDPDLVSRASRSSRTARPKEKRRKSREGAENEDLELCRRGSPNMRVDLLDQFEMFSKFGEFICKQIIW